MWFNKKHSVKKKKLKDAVTLHKKIFSKLIPF